jgi:hypothetical protein
MAPHYKEVYPWLEKVYEKANHKYLSDINRVIIEEFLRKIGILTEVIDSREFRLEGDRTEKLMNICTQLQAEIYLSGPAAKQYMDEALFSNAGIRVEYLDYSDYEEYSQVFQPFSHGVSIVDLLFNVGFNVKPYMKYVR